jgi:dTDP-4-amino-4,6-dideoxygalactose transaminase
VSSTRAVKFLSLKSQQALVRESFERAFSDILAAGQYILGERVKDFEREYATYSQTEFCVGVGSGLDALTVALTSLKLVAGDEVIVPANTYMATWLAISNSGCVVVPAEPRADTYNIDPDCIRDLLTKKTRAILPVHLYGQPCDMTRLSQIAQENKIEIIEDNAQAHGGQWNGKKTGSWGKINATSFYPTKNLGALGDGGAITTSDPQLAEFARMFRNYGSETKNYFQTQGINSRLDEMQAAFLSIKLRHLDQWNAERRSLASLYDERLKGISEIKIPYCRKEAHHVYHLYVIATERRDDLKIFLAKNGIETMVHYPVPPHQQKAYQNFSFNKRSFPITEKLAASVLSLPLWPGMSITDVEYVCEKVKAFYL